MTFKFHCLFLALFLLAAVAAGQETHQHHHGAEGDEPVERPKIFLDKSLRIVQYQLQRLSNERLLLVERMTDDAKYKPVYEAILTRDGMSRGHRDEALAALVQIDDADAADTLLASLETQSDEEPAERRVGRQLAEMLLDLPPETLRAKADRLKAATASEGKTIRTAGFAGLIAAGEAEAAQALARDGELATLDYLAAIELVPSAEQRATLRDSIVRRLAKEETDAVLRAAIRALSHVPTNRNETFALVAAFVGDAKFRAAAVKTLLAIPRKDRDRAVAADLADVLVKHAEATPAEQRTSNDFIDAMQLADELFALLPVEKSRPYRERLRAVTVRVVRIKTISEEMRYDTRFFAVEAGRPVQVVLQNEDLMPHNLVVTAVGALKEVAEEGAAVGPEGVSGGKPYVPDSASVMFATDMVPAGGQARLTFTAPAEPGEYPYVCTFPRHWMRMYGVMIVVKDLDAWQKDPKEPTDPTGNNRSFVQSWKFNDLKADLTEGLRGRSPEIGAKIFKEATCAQCHKLRGEGGAVGPDLSDVLKRFKGNRAEILREVLDPSHKIDPKFAVHVIYTVKGTVISGIVTDQSDDALTVVTNPEAPKPVVIARDDIDEMLKSSKSMMPKALLDQFTKDEIFELMAYLAPGK